MEDDKAASDINRLVAAIDRNTDKLDDIRAKLDGVSFLAWLVMTVFILYAFGYIHLPV